jgi:hypothetical protein
MRGGNPIIYSTENCYNLISTVIASGQKKDKEKSIALKILIQKLNIKVNVIFGQKLGKSHL